MIIPDEGLKSAWVYMGTSYGPTTHTAGTSSDRDVRPHLHMEKKYKKGKTKIKSEVTILGKVEDVLARERDRMVKK